VPRYSLETRYSRAGDVLTRHGCRAVRSLTVIRPNMADWTLSAGQIANLAVEPWGVRGVPAVGPVLIGYEHGRDYVDSDIEEACLLLADEAYGASTLDGRVVSQSADNMAVTYASGSRGPFVNARLNQIIRTNRLPGVVMTLPDRRASPTRRSRASVKTTTAPGLPGVVRLALRNA
jgi:hypothetical protein